jgi:hypothetical protein
MLYVSRGEWGCANIPNAFGAEGELKLEKDDADVVRTVKAMTTMVLGAFEEKKN